MHRPLSASILVASLLVGTSSPLRAASSSSSEAIARARGLMGRGEARPAVPLLEDALPAVAPDDRRALLDLLRRAYALAARQAEADGKADEAAGYRDNLAILDHSPRNQPAPDPAPSPAPAPEPAPMARPEPLPEVAPPSTADSAVARASAAVEAPEPASVPEPARPPDPAAEVASADAAFVAKRYDEAGRLYAAMAQANRLPASRRDHWAYCRCVEVVRRLNAGPATPEDWARIDAEIEAIRALSPKNWFGEYLRNRAAERTANRRVSRLSQGVVRGSSPDEPSPTPTPRTAAWPLDTGADAPGALRAAEPAGAGPTPTPSPSHEVGRAAGMPGNWQVRETPNFRIMHADAELAEKVAQVAEAARESQTTRWVGATPREAWSPKCDIYLYPTARIFSQMTGQPEPSPGFSTMGMNAGKIIARRINLRADHANLTAAVLPHEVAHVVLADLFPVRQIPRWADEGMAVLAEPDGEQRLRAADLSEPLASGKLFKVEDLMGMDYPDGRFWGLYYAQSVSLTRFLVEQGSPAQFIQFVQGAQRRNPEDELRRLYRIDGFADLQKRWLDYAKRQSSATATAAASPSAEASARR